MHPLSFLSGSIRGGVHRFGAILRRIIGIHDTEGVRILRNVLPSPHGIIRPDYVMMSSNPSPSLR
jgi:hypothetical protein